MKKTTKSVKSKKVRGIPAAVPVTARPSGPKFGGSTNSVIVKRKELVGSLTNGATVNSFTLLGLSQQIPGYDVSITCGTLFPWGSQIGYAFEKHRFRRLKVSLISAQPTTAAGRVYIGYDPDWSDDVPTVKSRFMGLACSVDASVWETVDLQVPASQMNTGITWRYNSPSTRTAEVEPRTAFAGWLAFAAEASTANCIWDLWVDYEVELMTPTSENLGPVEAGSELTNVAPTLGTDGKWYYMPSAWGPGSAPLEIVPPQMAGVTASYNGVPVNHVVKLPIAGPNAGLLDLEFLTHDVTLAPVDYQSLANQFGIDGACFDSFGNILGLLSGVAGIQSNFGTTVPGEGAIANKWAKGEIALPVQKLKAAYPTVSSVLPFVTSLANIALDVVRSNAIFTL